MIRGDATLGEYHYSRAGRSPASGRVFRFRLALADNEPLDRAAGYLADFGVSTDRFDFSGATVHHRPMTAIRTSKRASFDRISKIIEWPIAPCNDWHKGFLAGIFDAEGSCSEVIRIFNSDSEIIAAIRLSLKHFGFDHALESNSAKPHVLIVRVTGGLRERLRFLHTTGAAITRKRRIDDVALKSNAPLNIVAIEDAGDPRILYDITTGTGDFLANGVVSHNCFARRAPE